MIYIHEGMIQHVFGKIGSAYQANFGVNVTKIDEKFAVSSLRLRGTKQEAIRFSRLSGLLRLLRSSQPNDVGIFIYFFE